MIKIYNAKEMELQISKYLNNFCDKNWWAVEMNECFWWILVITPMILVLDCIHNKSRQKRSKSGVIEW